MARAAGIGRGELAGDRFRPVFRGVHRFSSTPYSPLLRGKAALLVHHPDAVLSHLFLDLAGTLQLVDLVVVGDWLVSQEQVTTASLRAYCAASTAPHAVHARRAAALVRDRVDSPMETGVRLLLVPAGLPEPVVNLEIRDGAGVLLRRLDLAYPSVRVAVEYDGRHHVDLVDRFEDDAVRRDDLAHDGWRLVTVTSRGIFRTPHETVQRVWRALDARGHIGLRRPADGFRPHFC
jgi:hypothetical protein